MVKIIFSFFFFAFILIFSCEEKNKVDNIYKSHLLSFQLLPVANNLVAPACMGNAGDERLFVLEQPGKIKIIKNGKILEQPFCDITSIVESGVGYSEKGLLGIAFHPEYKKNGKFYLYYSAHASLKGFDHKTVLAEYSISANPDIASSEKRIILEIPQPESNHNGGQIAFGKDGFLYIGTGDGGGAGDRHGKTGNGQDLNSLLGKILRIDIDKESPYSIPADNPFINMNARPEIWAYGLRNPWRFSIDRETGRIFCGDVGQNEYEEINIIERGKNYGWRAMEGNHVFDKALVKENMEPPIHEYPHSIGISIIGGYVYRGKNPFMQGKYFFADWNGNLFYLEQDTNKNWTRQEVIFDSKEQFTINSLAEDNEGELYILTQKEVGAKSNTGAVYKIALLK